MTPGGIRHNEDNRSRTEGVSFELKKSAEFIRLEIGVFKEVTGRYYRTTKG
jgi:hypothetical protein